MLKKIVRKATGYDSNATDNWNDALVEYYIDYPGFYQKTDITVFAYSYTLIFTCDA